MRTVIGEGRDLATFVENNQEEIHSCLETEGAILLRGFTPAGAELDRVARLLGLEPRTTYVPGIAPRKAAAPGNPAVFTSTEAPPHLPILPHTEMTYWPRPPAVLLFQCQSLQPGIAEANETVLYDTRAAAAELDQTLLDKLEKGCVFKRYYPGQFNPGWDVEDSVAGGSCWQRAFATEDTAEVEAVCRESGASFEWTPAASGGGGAPSLVTQVQLPWYRAGRLVLQTPLLGRQVYLDTIARFPSRFDNAAVRATLAAGSVAPRVELLGPGGGEFLSGEETRALMAALWRHAVFVAWQQGDLVILDNSNTAHARMNAAGRRRIVAAMADRISHQ